MENNTKLATLITSWELKRFGKTISKEEYVKYYNIPLDDSMSVMYIRGDVRLTKNMGDYNSVTYSSSVSLPVSFNITNPESEENFGRFEHGCRLRDYMLKHDLAEVKAIVIEEWIKEKNKSIKK